MTIASEAEARVVLGLISTITDAERAMLNLLLPAAEGRVIEHLGYDPEQREATEYYPRQEPSGGSMTGNVGWDVDASHRRAEMYVQGGGGLYPTLQLQRLPIRSVTNLWIDYSAKHGSAPGAFASASLKVQGQDYWVEFDQPGYGPTGCLMSSGAWPREPGTVKVAYRAGYSPAEFNGRATAAGTDSEGNLSTAGVNASPIKRAVLMTLTAGMQKWAALAKSSTGWKPGGLSSERLGDYSYTVGGNAAETIASLTVELPGTAIDLLEPFRHYGVMRL